MGTYYRIVCNEHNIVLDINKAYELNNELKKFIMDNHLTEYIYGDIYGDCVVKLNPVLNKIIRDSQDSIFGQNQRDRLLKFMNKHRNCDLLFQPDEPYDEEIRTKDGWKWLDIFDK